MQETVKVEELSNTEYRISIEVAADKVDQKFNEFFESIKAQAQVPGFRKGKAPLSRLKQFYGQKAKPTVCQMLISEYFAKALADHEINPVSNPKIDDFDPSAEYPGKFGFDNSYSISLVVETLPKIDPQGYRDMELNFPSHKEEELFEAKMKEYREQFAERSQITDRGAQVGDALIIDFKGFIGDNQFEGGTASGFNLEKLGQGHFIPGFEDQLVGVKVGETKDVNVTFPQEYRAAHLAGQDARFEVTVHSIIETKLAEVDEDLAMMVGYESVEELEAKVLEETAHEKRLRDRQLLDHQITHNLIEANDFTVPQSMVEREKLRLLGRTKLNNLPEQAKEELGKMAEYNVKRAIIMDAIYDKEDDIEVTPDELNSMLEEHARKNNQSKDELVSNLYNSGQMDNFVGVLRLASVMDFIIDNANKKGNEDNG